MVMSKNKNKNKVKNIGDKKEVKSFILGHTTFPAKEDAEKIVGQLHASFKPAEFCPMICEMCRTDCASWLKAYVVRNATDKYSVHGNRCTNPMVKGGFPKAQPAVAPTNGADAESGDES